MHGPPCKGQLRDQLVNPGMGKLLLTELQDCHKMAAKQRSIQLLRILTFFIDTAIYQKVYSLSDKVGAAKSWAKGHQLPHHPTDGEQMPRGAFRHKDSMRNHFGKIMEIKAWFGSTVYIKCFLNYLEIDGFNKKLIPSPLYLLFLLSAPVRCFIKGESVLQKPGSCIRCLYFLTPREWSIIWIIQVF